MSRPSFTIKPQGLSEWEVSATDGDSVTTGSLNHRGLQEVAKALEEAANMSRGTLTQIVLADREQSIESLRTLSAVWGARLDSIVAAQEEITSLLVTLDT